MDQFRPFQLTTLFYWALNFADYFSYSFLRVTGRRDSGEVHETILGTIWVNECLDIIKVF